MAGLFCLVTRYCLGGFNTVHIQNHGGKIQLPESRFYLLTIAHNQYFELVGAD